MNFSESFKQALDSLKSNKLRSFLTMLGIVMGVFSVITIMALGSATENYMNEQFERIGANTISITYKNANVDKRDWLTLKDMEYVKEAAPEIKNIATYIVRSGTVRVDDKTKDAQVFGVSSQYKNFAIIEMKYGRFINEFDVTKRAKFAVVDEYFVRKLFKEDRDVTGETITLKTPSGTVSIKIIGVMSSGENMFEGIMESDLIPVMIYMPITTIQQLYPNSEKLASIEVSVVEKDKLREVGKRIVQYLEMKHGSEDVYIAQNSADIQKAFSDVLGVVSSILLVIAVITLVVGGIGIVNILLVSVTERIREIGIRKALGAQKKDIILQFLTESILMTGCAGLVGIFLGIVAGGIISALIDIPPVVDLKVITLAFLGSVALGIVFGVYPAKRAADLDPIESLRYE
ncbi:MAG TPA: ABC transporter permease [Clostridiales bacterium]|mgnify:FL=1|nr:ABC transporter permease [Clostridiales bacterium]